MKLFTLFVVLLMSKIGSAVISIQNNRYKGVVIAIHNSVAEDHRIIDNLKELFTNASETLYKMTRNRSYFDDIAIIVPANWSKQVEYVQTIGGNRFSIADFRVDQPNEMYGNVPYTLQADSCGKSGQYVHLTPEFVKELHGNTAKSFGDPGKTLIHEWAHYRYGVFDEYADKYDEKTRPFYYDAENNIRATGCSENIPGWLADEGQPCSLGIDGLPNENCEFYPDMNANGGHSSLMYMHFLPTMEGFCDDTEELQHNSAAPSKHNIMCGGKSTWNVVSNHPDFLNDNNPPRSNLNPKPKFRILQPRIEDGGYFVLVLDVSGSMSGQRIAMLHRAAARFIKTQVPDKSQLAIVTFSTVPKTLADLTLVTPETREVLADRIPNKDDGGNTAIGQGLLLALEVLSDKDATDGGVIILISDGEENVLPHIADVIPKILRSRVRINTIAFGNHASRHLEKLVRLTGGHGYFFSDDDISGNKVAALQAAFFAAVSTQADVELQPVELNNNIFDIPSGSEQRGKIVVDEAIGRNTQFIFTAEEPSQLELALKSPSKKIHNNRTKTFIPDKTIAAASFNIPMAEVGKWEYRIKNNYYMKQVVGVSVISEPKDIRKQPIRIKAWISDVQFNYLQDASEAKIFAEVKKKYTPILGATVLAMVERPTGDQVEVELHDEGAGADIKKNDGIYSAYFTQFKGSGRYSVTARVVNDGNARVRVKKIGKPKQGALTIKKFDPDF
uniref:VWFA domain-containing protein n=1 Tax=Strigamia maritima TaxID=126957 RepID=T1II73_STRMM